MSYKLVIFDMDGTILDTLEDLAGSLNYALAEVGMPQRSLEEVRTFVGNGIRKLLERGVQPGSTAEQVDEVQANFMPHYKQHCADKTCAYPGILPLLAALKDAGTKLAVVSNKGDFAVQELCVQYFPGFFDMAVGEKEGVRKKPMPDSVNLVLQQLDVAGADAVYVGDSEVDIATARNAGLECIVVGWGFRDEAFLLEQGAEAIIKSTDELAQLLLG